MYINDIHILIYLLFIIFGAGIGLFAGWCNERLPENKKIFSKEIFLEYKTRLKPSYILAAINAILYVILLYKFGIKTTFVTNFIFIQYLILIPILLSTFVIDYRLTIIPNRLNLTLFEIGLVVTVIFGILNFNLALDAVYGMLVGGGIFLLISIIGGMIAGKEAMGMGDVKLMGALRTIFWTYKYFNHNIIIILNRCNNKHHNINFKKEQRWIPAIWTIYSNSNNYNNDSTKSNINRHTFKNIHIRTLLKYLF